MLLKFFSFIFINDYIIIKYNFSQQIFAYKNTKVFNFLFFKRDWDFIPYFTFVYIQMSCLLGHKIRDVCIMLYFIFMKNQTKNAQILSLKLKHF